MKEEEIKVVLALGSQVTFLPGSWDKRFAHQMYQHAFKTPEKELTISQREWIFRLLYKYRRQVPEMYEKFQNVPECSRKDEKQLKSLSKKSIEQRSECNFPEQKNLFSDLKENPT